ncbi:MAG: hypothetical protein ABI599_16200 [Flavobacteriales bacterium]
MEERDWEVPDAWDDREDLHAFAMYYNPVSREIIDLANGLAALLRKNGVHLADAAERLKELERIKEQVHAIAHRRQVRGQEEGKEEAEAFLDRLKAQCATCGIERDVHIIGDAVHKEAGITNDLVRCTTCNTEFVNLMPHGWENKIKWMEFLCTQLTTVRDDGLTWAEKVPDRPAVALLVEQIKAMRKMHAEQAREQRANKLAEGKVDEQLVVMRDALLLLHLQASGRAGGGGMA